MKEELCYYSVIRYVPSVVRDERVNVGLIMVSPEGFVQMKGARDLRRVTALDPDSDVDMLKKSLEGLENRLKKVKLSRHELWGCRQACVDFLQRSVMDYRHAIQLDEPKSAWAADLSKEFDRLYRQLVVERETPARERRKKRLSGIVTSQLKAANMWHQVEVRKQVLLRAYGIPIQVDFAYLNSCQHYIQLFPLDTMTSSEQLQEAKVWGWNYAQIRKEDESARLISLVAGGSENAATRRILEDAHSEVFEASEEGIGTMIRSLRRD